jgi:hypothetical protein
LDVKGTLADGKLCLNVGSQAFFAWPANASAAYREVFLGLLSGRVRLVEFTRGAKIFKAELQDSKGRQWRTIATYRKFQWPSLRFAQCRAIRNRQTGLDDALIADLRDFDSSRAARKALRNESTTEDLPALRGLLNDAHSHIREAAAAPVSDLEGVSALRDLLVVFQRGLSEGYENDRFAKVLIRLAKRDPAMAKQILLEIIHDEAEDADGLRMSAIWLADYVRGD